MRGNAGKKERKRERREKEREKRGREKRREQMDRRAKGRFLKQEKGITRLCGLRFLTLPFPYSASLLLSFSTFDLIPLPTIDPRASLPLTPASYCLI